MSAGFSSISKAEIFAHLAKAHAADAQTVVVTPNRRLALALKRAFDAHQVNAGLTVWASADVLPFSAFVERAYQEATGAEWPLLLTPLQEQHLWESIVTASKWGELLLAPTATAAQCAGAWQLVQAWRIDLNMRAGNEDAQAFADWARAYDQRCKRDHLTDAARLPDVVVELLRQNAVRKPAMLIAYAFDVLTPQQRDVFSAYQNVGSEIRASAFLENAGPALQKSNVIRIACNAPREELECAAQWARTRLEENAGSPASSPQNAGAHEAPRIAVVVPELEQRRAEVEHVFNQVLNPGGAAEDEMPARFNISLGLPLAQYPLVAHALAIFDLAHGSVAFEVASKLLRSPFIAGAEDEFAARAQLDAVLRKQMPAQLSLPKLIGAIHETKTCARLAETLQALYAYAQEHLTHSASPQAWARHFSALLENAGFPGERELDSAEYQTREKLKTVFAEFVQLERVTNKMHYAHARARLRRVCNDTVFQPQQSNGGDAPIQVLGIFESAGMAFDYLWVSGLTDDAWPLAARPHPFIAPALQKKAGIPQASGETSFALAKRITHGWRIAAPEVMVSHALRDGDRELSPSPLIADVAQGALLMPALAKYQALIHASAVCENIENDIAPAFAGNTVGGGTRVLADQAACPFRAFARHRLKAETLETPQEGLDAMGRGILVHALLGFIWERLKTRVALLAIAADALDALIEDAVAHAMTTVRIEGRFAQLEAQRLKKLARDWLEVERARADFEVVAIEEKRALDAGGLKLSGRIDRMDKLDDGSYALIDYKTGKQLTPKSWLDARPDDPQLPLYAINANEDIAAVAFARVRVGMTRFYGLTRADKVLPGVKTAESWDGLFDMWRREIAALGQGFRQGDARVAPKQSLKTCAYCDLQPLCRVHEQMPALDGEEEE